MARRKTVLIVEDDRDIRETLSELLEREGYVVHTAVNGREGAARAAEIVDLGLVLVDYRMPGMDGFEFRQKQLSDASLAAVPTILMSADTSFSPEVPRAFTAFLPKPLCIDDVLEVVERYTTERLPA